MEDTTSYLQLVRVVPVVIGALLAIAGGLASQVLIHWFASKREDVRVRRDRIEAFVKAVYAHGQWLKNRQQKMVFRNEDHDVESPLDEARMIQALHFPELANELLEIQQVELLLLEWINKQRQKRREDTEQFMEGFDSEEFFDGYKKYVAAVSKLTTKSRNLIIEQRGN